MYKVAPRYLSGVSVFLGDDITKREVTGEIAVIVGQSIKGPSYPVQLKSAEQAIGLYGVGSPILKGLFEFNDGYLDSPKAQNIKYVTLRLGGTKLTFTTTYGVAIESVDAYDNLEDDFYIYINDKSASSANIKIWDKNKQLVYDYLNGVNGGYFVVTGLPTGSSKLEYGVDCDIEPLAEPTTVKELITFELKTDDRIPVPLSSSTTLYNWTNVQLFDITTVNEIPTKGTIKLTKQVNGVDTYLTFRYGISYSETNGSTLFSYDNVNLTSWTWATCTSIQVIGADEVTFSSSELDITSREVYEKLRTALLEIEMYTPDYIIPAGIPYDAKQLYSRPYTKKTILKADATFASWNSSQKILVEDTTDWPETGYVYLTNKSNVESGLKYTSLVASGDYTLVSFYQPNTPISSKQVKRLTPYALRVDLGAAYTTDADAYLEKGYCIFAFKHTKDNIIHTVGSRYHTVIEKGIKYVIIENVAVNYYDDPKFGPVVPVHIFPCLPGNGTNIYFTTNTTIETSTFYKDEYFDMGIGFVKETDYGDHITFEWSDVKKQDYYTAHFGYLIGKFCNDATLGYNTPLFGMNVEVPFTSTPTRTQLVSWIGTLPSYTIYGNETDQVTAVLENGSGLLGDFTLAGGMDYNRCSLTDVNAGTFADPAYGLLLTDQGFIDGTIIKDDYGKLVDLGKFGIVGAGLLTFSNSSSTSSYIDAMGIYTLGMVAGLPKSSGASFRQIGASSGVTVSAVVPRNFYNDLARLGYTVTTREKGLGWVINNDQSIARDNSGYYLLSTTRTIKYVIEAKRAILAGFIGKPLNTYNYEAAKTKLSESFTADISNGMLNGFKFTLDPVETTRLMGKLRLNCSINPVLELVQVDINAVIDRNVTSTTV